MSFIAPKVHDLAAFAKKASPEELMWEIRRAVCSIETPNPMERARRTMYFLDDMPIVIQGAFNQGYFACYIQTTHRSDCDVIQ
jgi:hypothetical protein